MGDSESVRHESFCMLNLEGFFSHGADVLQKTS